MHREFWWVNLKKRSHLKVLSIKGVIILKRPSRNRMGGLGLDWSGQGYGVENTVMDPWVS
jgi:hypothetical protein